MLAIAYMLIGYTHIVARAGVYQRLALPVFDSSVRFEWNNNVCNANRFRSRTISTKVEWHVCRHSKGLTQYDSTNKKGDWEYINGTVLAHMPLTNLSN